VSTLLEKYRAEFARGRSFDENDAEQVIDALIESENEALLASLFDGWNRKGIEEHEIYLLAKIMRERCVKVDSRHKKVVDIVGTGGSKVKTFNVSTAAAFVVAGEGVPVAKHGNKAATSNSGSADVLNELGIDHAVSPAEAERSLNTVGICFMFAPNHHRFSPTLARVRRGLGFPTIFNCVGPLCNPAGAQHQLIGVWDSALVTKMANALAKLGTKRSWVVHGHGGLDEISITGLTEIAEVANAEVSEFSIVPTDFGVDGGYSELPRAKSPQESAELIRSALHTNQGRSAAKTLTTINAAASTYIGGFGTDLRDSFEQAFHSIEAGNALAKLKTLVKFQRS
jgi:anthranilate phosphoribosyltransferase